MSPTHGRKTQNTYNPESLDQQVLAWGPWTTKGSVDQVLGVQKYDKNTARKINQK